MLEIVLGNLRYRQNLQVAKELHAQHGQHDCLDRPITKEDDNRVLLLEGTVTDVVTADEPSPLGETEIPSSILDTRSLITDLTTRRIRRLARLGKDLDISSRLLSIFVFDDAGRTEIHPLSIPIVHGGCQFMGSKLPNHHHPS